jgi:7-keto-8-aminopelargonate synthetase-like enzyme
MPGHALVQDEATHATLNGRRVLCFAGCNYLGLAFDPRVLAAARDAVGRVGVSSSASRETSGNTVEHASLEAEVCDFVTRRDPGRAGLLLPDGYTANLAAAQTLARTHRHAVIDARAHMSLVDSAAAAGMTPTRYAHRDADSLGEALNRLPSPAVVMTDGVFTADGSLAPLRELLACLRDDDLLVVDDCHGFCVLGEAGRGSLDEAGIRDERVVLTTTLAKGLGCGGGIVIGPRSLIEAARGHATAYICTTPVSPIVAAAGREALRTLVEEPGRVERVRANAARLALACEPWACAGAGSAGRTPIAALAPEGVGPLPVLAERLLECGVYVPLMKYPGGPVPWYFRATVTSAHTAAQIEELGEILGSFARAALCRGA